MTFADTRKTVRHIQPTVKIKNKNIDLSPYVKVIETYKSLKQPAGTFTIELSPKNSKDNITSFNLAEKFYTSIDTMDIIEIGITKPGLMVGLIDSADKTKSIRTDNYTRNLSIKGRDFAKLLIEDSIVYSPQLASNEYAVKILGKERLSFMGELLLGQSSQLFNNPICALLFILKNIPAAHIEVPFTDVSDGPPNEEVNSGKLGKYFICDLKAFLGDRVTGSVVSQISGKIWNSMLLCIDENFYELFVDTVTVDIQSGREARPCLFLRPKPYDRTADNVIRIKDIYGSSDAKPASQAKAAAKAQVSSMLSSLTGSSDDKAAKAKAEAAVPQVMKSLISFNKVIYPRAARKDIVFTDSEGNENPGNVTTNVTLAGIDRDGKISDPLPAQFDGQRDINNPDDEKNKSMVIPWTWDGNDSFYRTMVTNEQYHVIHDEDILQEALGVFDDEVINYITIRSRKDTGQSSSFMGYSYPLMDGYKIRKFGLRAFNVESNLLDTSYKLNASSVKNYSISGVDEKDIFSAAEYVNNRERIFNWYRYNDIFESGIMIIKGNQDIRIGDKIYMPDALSKGGHHGIYAYVQGVRNRYEITPAGLKYETTLEIVRGENPKDIEDYRSIVNSGSGENLKLGTTYKTYDDGLGAGFEGSPEDTNAHNIIKYDAIKSIGDLNTRNKNRQKVTNKMPGEDNNPAEAAEPGQEPDQEPMLEPKYSGYISPDAESSRKNLKGMGGCSSCSEKPFSSYIPDIQSQIEGGSGIDDKVFQFLEGIGSLGFPFKMEILSLVTGYGQNIENDPNKQVTPHSQGKAVDITVNGDTVKNTTMLIAYIMGKEIGNVKPDNRLYSLLLSRGAMPKIIIACPNQSDGEDLKLCKGVSTITDDMRQRHRSVIQLIF
ncbi:MAG: hypothetical protein EHM58_00470 [Ignavibacteriae bacterium]|nr:MAG: hypothetical protein EHM58_00470 [Ignavibacteriota bacterium]